jgi:hypothetical protein
MEMEIFCLSNFAMGTILGKGFAQAQVHTEKWISMNSIFGLF